MADALEDIRGRKQAILQKIAEAAGDDAKQFELQGQLQDLRKEKAGVVAAPAETAEEKAGVVAAPAETAE